MERLVGSEGNVAFDGVEFFVRVLFLLGTNGEPEPGPHEIAGVVGNFVLGVLAVGADVTPAFDGGFVGGGCDVELPSPFAVVALLAFPGDTGQRQELTEGFSVKGLDFAGFGVFVTAAEGEVVKADFAARVFAFVDNPVEGDLLPEVGLCALDFAGVGVHVVNLGNVGVLDRVGDELVLRGFNL